MPKTPATPPPVSAKPRKPGRPTSARPTKSRTEGKGKSPETLISTAQPLSVEVEAGVTTSQQPSGQGDAETDRPLDSSADTGSEALALAAKQRAVIEALSVNLARAAMTAQTAMTEAAMGQAGRLQAGDAAPPSTDPFNIAPAMSSVMSGLAARPDKLFSAHADLFNRYLELWSTASRRVAGEPIDNSIKDKRFKDPAWSENPMFDMMRQSYLVTSDWMNGLVAGVEGIDPTVKRRAEFFTKLLTDAFSPANFLASNPVALKALAESNGESLVRGMQNFAADLEAGAGKLRISQADYEKFRVGENVATAPGQVIWRDELFELIQYDAASSQQRQIPLLIFPPWINKFYIMDLQPANSLIRWLSAQGFSVFVCSWVNPDTDKAGFGFDDYLDKGIYRATQKVTEQTGQDRLNTVGYCIGGTLMGAALGHMAECGDERVNATTFFAAQHDFQEAGDLLLFTDDHWLAEVEQQMDAAGGVLPGSAMADTFNALRANDLIWSFFVSNYLMGKSPAAFDLLFWNADQTRMPKRLHMDYLRQLYGENRLSKGEFEIGGVKVDLKRVKVPLYFQASREDHIAPMASVYRSAKAFGSEDVTFTLAGSGHIAGVINPPSANKYQHWVNPDLSSSLSEWQAQAEEHPGSWWNHWAEWLHARSGIWMAPRDPSQGPLSPIEPAPGSYVQVKS